MVSLYWFKPNNMIRTVKADESAVNMWALKYYCGVSENLTGQTVIIKSVFKKERTPSMKLFVTDAGEYRFNDFATGQTGGSVKLVAAMFNLSFKAARAKMMRDYHLHGGSVVVSEPVIKESNYIVNKIFPRGGWTKADADYWKEYGISSKTLSFFNVKSLSKVDILYKGAGHSKSHKMFYGYFKNSGGVHKLYSPRTDRRFLAIDGVYIQGIEQLKYDKPTLIICSSLKDMMSIHEMNLNVELVSPNSENALIPIDILKAWHIKYDTIATLFDNDVTGIKSMEKYEEKYGIPGIYLTLEKDVSDSVKKYGRKRVKNMLQPLIESL